MHIWEGALSGSPTGLAVLGVGVAGTAAGTYLGLRRLDYERVPRVAMLSSAFFVASLIAVPLGPSPAHLVLNGLLGIVLGWAAFPAMLIALLLQAVFFQFGGLTTLGINTLIMALPAVACHALFSQAARSQNEAVAFLAGMIAGMTGVMLAAVLAGGSWLAAGKGFEVIGGMTVLANMAVAVLDGLVTGSAVVFLRKVRPELLDAPLLAPARGYG